MKLMSTVFFVLFFFLCTYPINPTHAGELSHHGVKTKLIGNWDVQAETIQSWFQEGLDKGATHMIICYTHLEPDFKPSLYPMYICMSETLQGKLETLSSEVYPQEIYALDLDFEKQFAEAVTWHVESPSVYFPVEGEEGMIYVKIYLSKYQIITVPISLDAEIDFLKLLIQEQSGIILGENHYLFREVSSSCAMFGLRGGTLRQHNVHHGELLFLKTYRFDIPL